MILELWFNAMKIITDNEVCVNEDSRFIYYKASNNWEHGDILIIIKTITSQVYSEILDTFSHFGH